MSNELVSDRIKVLLVDDEPLEVSFLEAIAEGHRPATGAIGLEWARRVLE